jgi:biopolymer transport protein ExbD
VGVFSGAIREVGPVEAPGRPCIGSVRLGHGDSDASLLTRDDLLALVIALVGDGLDLVGCHHLSNFLGHHRQRVTVIAVVGNQDGDDISESHEINVTPFIDVMLVLLIIFMVVAPLSTVDVPVELPVSQAQPAQKPDKPLYVTLKSDLSLAVGNDMVLWTGLASALDAQTNNDRTKRLFLRADKLVPYSELMRLMDALRAAGYLKVALVGLEGPPAAALPAPASPPASATTPVATQQPASGTTP